MNLTTVNKATEDLELACRWLDISQGRVRKYVKLLKELNIGRKNHEHLMMSFEIFDLLEIYHLWRDQVHNFPGLKSILKNIFKDGPIFAKDEKNDNAKTVHSRNNAFSVIVAGQLLNMQFEVEQVEGCPRTNTKTNFTSDCTISFNRRYINIECKRLQSLENWLKRLQKGKRQINRLQETGVVALDCSVPFLHEKGNVCIAAHGTNPADQFLNWLQSKIYPDGRATLSSSVIGLMLFIRVPTLIETRPNSRKYRMFCGTSCLIVGYDYGALGKNVMTLITQKYRDYLGSACVDGII